MAAKKSRGRQAGISYATIREIVDAVKAGGNALITLQETKPISQGKAEEALGILKTVGLPTPAALVDLATPKTGGAIQTKVGDSISRNISKDRGGNLRLNIPMGAYASSLKDGTAVKVHYGEGKVTITVVPK